MANEEKPTKLTNLGIDLTQSFQVTGICLSSDLYQGTNKKGAPYERCTTMLLVGSTPVSVIEFSKPGEGKPAIPGQTATYKLTPGRDSKIIELNGARVA